MVVIGITGFEGSGKTALTANIGACLAMRGVRTLLIDADLYFPNLAFQFGVTPKYTIHSYLENPRMDLEWLTYPYLEIKNLHLLLGDPNAPIRHRLSFKGLNTLIEYFKSAYGAVLVDFPSGLPIDAHPIVSELDYQVLVIDPSTIPLRNLNDWVDSAIRKFLHLGIEDFWVILNKPLIPEKNLEALEKFISEELEVPLLGTVPYDPSILEGTYNGIPICAWRDELGVITKLSYTFEEIFF
ncbi:MinD/ParA family protein [Thermococcus sp.]|uniref:MinD/ParA family ATP-binding protein n=1 Tax=Thermococcus sp. TaxID=35749 RepID=UPI0025F03537|nr:MinD/ParA family protein [Thermococcus sp.]